MTDIARAAGLHQSSLYYWFARKELVLEAVVAPSLVPVEFVESIVDGPGSAGLKLYRFVRLDTFRLFGSPLDANEVVRLAERQPEVFDGYWAGRNRLHRIVVRLLRSGVSSGELVDCDPHMAALQIVSFDEGIQKGYRHQEAHRLRGGHRFTHPSYSREAFAEATAATIVRSFLARPSSLARIVRQASAYDDLELARRADGLDPV